MFYINRFKFQRWRLNKVKAELFDTEKNTSANDLLLTSVVVDRIKLPAVASDAT